MKVVLFSSHYPGNVSKYNVAKLIAAYPDYEYTYVLVDNKKTYLLNKLKNVLKEIVLLLLFKHPDWYADRRKVEHKIGQHLSGKNDAQVRRIYVKDVNGIETENVIKNLSPDIILQCGAGILKENIFSIARLGTLNLHHGIAPELRGVSSTFWAMCYGLYDYIGTTVHFIDKTLDTGIVILQKKTDLPQTYDFVEAAYQTTIQGAELLPKAIEIIQQKYEVSVQDIKSYYFSTVTYTKYWELKKNKFKPIGNSDSLKYKMKNKKVIINH